MVHILLIDMIPRPPAPTKRLLVTVFCRTHVLLVLHKWQDVSKITHKLQSQSLYTIILVFMVSLQPCVICMSKSTYKILCVYPMYKLMHCLLVCYEIIHIRADWRRGLLHWSQWLRMTKVCQMLSRWTKI